MCIGPNCRPFRHLHVFTINTRDRIAHKISSLEALICLSPRSVHQPNPHARSNPRDLESSHFHKPNARSNTPPHTNLLFLSFNRRETPPRLHWYHLYTLCRLTNPAKLVAPRSSRRVHQTPCLTYALNLTARMLCTTRETS